MVMSWIFSILLGISFICSIFTDKIGAISAAIPEGAQAGITLAVSMAGSLCLWSGVGKLLEASGITEVLSRLLRPLLKRIFPGSQQDPKLAGALCGNICANFLGLGNASTPMGLEAVRRMKHPEGVASDEMCRLIVLNTASIQLIPANVAAIRSALGCETPFDILPEVWITSFFSALIGVLAAWFFGRMARHG